MLEKRGNFQYEAVINGCFFPSNFNRFMDGFYQNRKKYGIAQNCYGCAGAIGL